VNLTSVFNSAKAELPHIIKSGGGSIVNIASLAGVIGEPNFPAYVASKHGVVGLSKSIAIDYGKQGVRCNAVCPSFAQTPMTLEGFPDQKVWDKIAKRNPTGKLVTAEDVANTVVYLLSPRSGSVNGGTHVVDAGVSIT
jgi:NAD(P)-dependent dehydrogenase (short-subunit alcohol dehydrogenase family)